MKINKKIRKQRIDEIIQESNRLANLQQEIQNKQESDRNFDASDLRKECDAILDNLMLNAKYLADVYCQTEV